MALKGWTKIKVQYWRDKKDLRKKAQIRPAAILTTSYVASDEVNISGFSKAAVFFEFTKGSLTELLIKVQQSIDGGVTWFDAPAESVTLTKISIGLPEYSRTPVAATERWYWTYLAVGELMRVQVKGVGTATGSSCALHIVGVY